MPDNEKTGYIADCPDCGKKYVCLDAEAHPAKDFECPNCKGGTETKE